MAAVERAEAGAGHWQIAYTARRVKVPEGFTKALALNGFKRFGISGLGRGPARLHEVRNAVGPRRGLRRLHAASGCHAAQPG